MPKEKNEYIYTGVFFEPDEIYDALKTAVPGREIAPEHRIEYPHVTFAYRPKDVSEALFGQKVTVKITGYGLDDRNEGFLADIAEASEEVLVSLEKGRLPHITLAVFNGGKPKDTSNLKFIPIEPIVLTGVYGAFGTDLEGVNRYFK